MAGSGAGTGLPLVLSQRGQASQGVALGGFCHSVLGPGVQDGQGKKDHLLSMARVLKFEVLIFFGFYIFLSRQVISQFWLCAWVFFLVLLLQW